MPRYGFNFQWMVSWTPGQPAEQADEKALDFLQAEGFDFVRIPTDYRYWTKDFDYFHPDEAVFANFDRYLAACQAHGQHLSLNIHRAPGYCINRNDLERDNLWTDQIAQDAFVFLWETFARRFLGVSDADLSFDLLNEPPDLGQYGMHRDNHAALMRRTIAAVRAIDPARPIVIDGLGGGNIAMPELADLGVIHSGRGYQPQAISHYLATWWPDWESAPEPKYPGLDWNGRIWDKAAIRDYYRPWREVEQRGATVHIGECGCYNQTPNDIALRWYADLFSLYQEFGWGFALWNFVGPFGIIDHGRPGAHYEQVHGYQVDRDLLEIICANRIGGPAPRVASP